MGHPSRRRIIVPRQASPIRLEEALGQHWDNIVSGFSTCHHELLDINPLARLDSNKSAEARRLLDKAKHKLERKLHESKSQVEGLAGEFAKRTSDFQRQQLSRQTEAALGINLMGLKDANIGKHLHEFVRNNVSLIKRIGEDQHDAIADTVMEAVHEGTHHEALQEKLRNRFGVSKRHARLIARDQTGKLVSRVNRTRQEHLGFKHYTWKSMLDERVRDSHQDMEGVVCSFDDPPIVDGEAAHPGEPVQCRCYSEPCWDDLLG